MSPETLLEQSFGSIGELIRAHAARRPGHTALRQDERRLDYAALDATMDRVAAALQAAGLKPRDAIAVCAANSIEYAAVFLGALRAGIAVAPLAFSASAASLAAMIADSGARLLFLDTDAARRLEPGRGAIALPRVALDGSPFGTAFDAWLAPPGHSPAPVAIEPDWPFNIIYSSGTTGTPKGIVQPHRMRWGYLQRARISGYDADAVTLIATPLYSNTTLVSFFPTLALGGSVLLMAKFDPRGYLALAERHRVTHTMLVPVQYQRLMALPEFARYDLSAFRAKYCTSAPFPAALKADILRRWPGGLTESYGLTEGGGSCILAAHLHPDKLHTVGRPAPGHDIRLIDDAGRELPPGTTGEVVGRSPVMMTGYHNQPGKTAQAEWFDAAGRRFIRTGDIGRFDADGFLTLLDRKKDLIISGGFNIYPSDLETLLCEHPAVDEAAVVGVPSQRWGETPVAFAVLAAGAGARAEELLDWANARLGKTQRLAALCIAAALPRSAIGKVLKRELRERYLQTVDDQG